MERTRQLLELPTNLSLDELLSVLDNKEAEKLDEIRSNKNDVVSFLMAYGIKPGEYRVTRRLLYSLYRLWTKDPIELHNFANDLSKYIVLEGKYYFIDQSSFKINEEIQNYILNHSRDKTKNKSYKKHFEYFLQKYSIKPGDYYIESFILYYLYDKWVYGIRKNTPLGYYPFLKFCRLYFKTKRNSENRVTWFGIDKECLFKVITEQTINNLRKGRKMRYVKKVKKGPKEMASNRSNSKSKN